MPTLQAISPSAELLALQRAAYAVEADLIGDHRIPALSEDLAGRVCVPPPRRPSVIHAQSEVDPGPGSTSDPPWIKVRTQPMTHTVSDAATVKTHVAHLLTKLGVRDRVQAVILSYETGLVLPGSS